MKLSLDYFALYVGLLPIQGQSFTTSSLDFNTDVILQKSLAQASATRLYSDQPVYLSRDAISKTGLASRVDASGGDRPGGDPSRSAVGSAGGGPPIGAPQAGGPPPPAGGPGGPPPQTTAQKVLEVALEIAFKLLYLGDDSGVKDSSKNLRVLWTRALLNSLGRIKDPIASELLPRRTRWIVGNTMAKKVWKGTPVVEKLDWIVNRTKFIDQQLEEFLTDYGTSYGTKRQAILLGSGYDTRSLRYARYDLDVYEVDIPDVIAMKSKMVERFLQGSQREESINFVPLDLNEVLTRNRSLVDEVRAAGFRDDVPTIVICEAVFFYLIPGAVQKVSEELFQLTNAKRYCITDNLAKVGVAPGPPVPSPREKCERWIQDNGKELIAHDSIWGGAIHFVGAKTP